ncbi:MepB family protein [Nocardia sp. NPDC058058]|uniref:MepB family protein n=1 Tax=Nocardia sp. NPDC058058 TaxID=3346317 RepID=UPI0036DCD0F1
MHPDVTATKALLDRLDLGLSGAAPEATNAEYGAFVARVGCGMVRFRVGRLTPTKVGLFVAVWRRAADGSTEPFTAEDGIDLLVVMVREGERFGQFVFPSAALVQHGIVSLAGGDGKRGFRVYPPWSATANKQAMRSQKWQCEYFLDLRDAQTVELPRARELYDLVRQPRSVPQ